MNEIVLTPWSPALVRDVMTRGFLATRKIGDVVEFEQQHVSAKGEFYWWELLKGEVVDVLPSQLAVESRGKRVFVSDLSVSPFKHWHP